MMKALFLENGSMHCQFRQFCDFFSLMCVDACTRRHEFFNCRLALDVLEQLEFWDFVPMFLAKSVMPVDSVDNLSKLGFVRW